MLKDVIAYRVATDQHETVIRLALYFSMQIRQTELFKLAVYHYGFSFWLECGLISKLGTSDSDWFGRNYEASPQDMSGSCVKLNAPKVKIHKAPLTF